MKNASRPSLLLVTIDALRADHVGWQGYAVPTTPQLDRLAAKSTVFENAIVAGFPTYFSLPALLAGRYPLAMGRDLIGLVPGETTLAGTLRQAGYHTAAFVAANPYAGRWSGFADGFDTFEDFVDRDRKHRPDWMIYHPTTLQPRLRSLAQRLPGGAGLFDRIYFRYGLSRRARFYSKAGWEEWRQYPSAAALVTRALTWLRTESRRPYFVWLHFMDAHRPYLPTSESLNALGHAQITPRMAFEHYNLWGQSTVSADRRAKYLPTEIALYDAAIRDIDTQVARIVNNAGEESADSPPVIAITSDHGEAFTEGGAFDHDPIALHRSLTHVPLLIHAPTHTPQRITAAISLLDLPPTLLDVVDVPRPLTFEGTSRSGLTNRHEAAGSIVLTEVVKGRSKDQIHGRGVSPGPRLMSAQTAAYKLVVDGESTRAQLLDWKNDCLEDNSIPLVSHRKEAAQLLRALRNHMMTQHNKPYTLGQLQVRIAILRDELARRLPRTADAA